MLTGRKVYFVLFVFIFSIFFNLLFVAASKADDCEIAVNVCHICYLTQWSDPPAVDYDWVSCISALNCKGDPVKSSCANTGESWWCNGTPYYGYGTPITGCDVFPVGTYSGASNRVPCWGEGSQFPNGPDARTDAMKRTLTI